MFNRSLYLLLIFGFVLTGKANAQEPKLVLPIGHTNLISSICFSPDTRYVVTASYDNTARIWDPYAGKLIATLSGHTQGLSMASYSSTGKYIVTAGGDGLANVWEANSGQLIHTLKGHTGSIYSARFSPDGRYIVTASLDKTAKIWKVSTGELLYELKGHTNAVNSAVFSYDGHWVTTCSQDGTAKVWNTQTGKLYHDLIGHTDNVTSAVFTPDGKFIVTTSFDKTARTWNMSDGIQAYSLKSSSSFFTTAAVSPDSKYLVTGTEDGIVQMCQIATGKLIYSLEGHTREISSICFSSDGSKILTASYDHTAKAWDIRSGKLIINLKGHKGFITTAVFSSDGNYVATGSDDQSARIWNMNNGSLVSVLWGRTFEVEKTAISPDGKYFATGSEDNIVRIWDAANGKLLSHFEAYKAPFRSLSFSNDGNFLAAAFNDTMILVWNVFTGHQIMRIPDWSDFAFLSPTGNYLICDGVGGVGSAMLWNTIDGTNIELRNGHTKMVTGASFSFDGKWLATCSEDHTVIVWNAITGQLVTRLQGHTNYVSKVFLSPDGKYLISTEWDNTTLVWNVFTGQIIATIHEAIETGDFTNDGKYLLTVSRDKTIRYIEMDSLNVVKTINVKENGEIGAINANHEFLLLINNGKAIKYDCKTGKIGYTFFAVDEKDYLVTDNNNHYDGTAEARKLLYFTCGTELIELNQVKDQLWVPNLAERIIKGDSIQAKSLDELNICGLTPEVEEIISNEKEFAYRITPRRGGLGKTIVYVNGIEAGQYLSEKLIKTSKGYELRIKKEDLRPLFIPGKENPVLVKAFTAANDISSRGLIITAVADEKASPVPNLFAVVIGVSDYKGEELDLKYADKDAADISNAISLAAKKLLNTGDGKEHVFMYNLTTAKDHYRLPEKKAIKNVLEEIGNKATANDILLVFFAGHGVMADPKGNNVDKKQFYFLTADASHSSAADAIKDVGISTEELTDWIQPKLIKAQKRVFIFDACNSGQAISDFVKMGKEGQGYISARGDDKSQLMKALDKLNEKSGLFILSASASNQNAYEMGRYSQGLLTYSLLKAIKQQPDILMEGKYLDLGRWFNAAKETVSDLSRESGARQEPQVISNTNFNIGIVDEEVMTRITLPVEKPIFAAGNFMNGDENIADDNLELSKWVNLQLNDIAKRGTESRITYSSSGTLPDAWVLNGRYDVKGEELSIKVNLKQGKEIKYRYELTRKKESIKDIADKIVQQAMEWISRNTKN